MFNPKNIKTLSRELRKSHFARYFFQSLEGVSKFNKKTVIDIPIENSYSPIRSSLIFRWNWFTASCWWYNICHWWSNKLGTSWSFCLVYWNKTTKISDKHLEKFENLETTSLFHKTASSFAGSFEIFYGFDSDNRRKREDLPNEIFLN